MISNNDLTPEQMQEVAEKFGIPPNLTDKDFAEKGLNLMRIWSEDPPKEMAVPLISFTSMLAILAEYHGADKNREEMMGAIHHAVRSIWNMGYRMGQYGLRNPYAGPPKGCNN